MGAGARALSGGAPRTGCGIGSDVALYVSGRSSPPHQLGPIRLPIRRTVRPRLTALALALLGSVASPLGARAQAISDSALMAAMPPACHESGLRRVAVMVPPGQTTEQLRTALGRGMFPAGTEAAILQPGQLMPLRNGAEFQKVMSRTLTRLSDDGVKIDGTLSTLLVVDAEGMVREAHPNSRDNQVNRVLADAWKKARLVPYVLEGCRVPAWVHAPLSFHNDWSLGSRQTEVRTGAPPR